jgi:plasmid maintenance system antidote protein VapI
VTGVHRTSVVRIENARGGTTVITVLRIARALGTSPDQLHAFVRTHAAPASD